MVKFFKKINFLLLIIISVIITGCANQLPPGGGAVDNISPAIIEVSPQNLTKNFNEDFIELGFSEYIDKRSLKDAIFISPALEGEIELDWSGKYVRILFPEKLKENTTYNLTIGTDVADFNNQNKMTESFQLTFSTGNVIDTMMITGKVFEKEPTGILIYAFKNITDTLLNRKPDYISQVGTTGEFSVSGLSAGTYRLFAVKDEFRDLLFQAEQDRIGIPSKDIKLTNNDSISSSKLYFKLEKYDTIPPILTTAAMLDSKHILLTFSEDILAQNFSSTNFYISDSTGLNKIPVIYAYKNINKENEAVLVVKDSLNIENNYLLNSNMIYDVNNNRSNPENIGLTLSGKPDTVKPMIVNTIPPASSKDFDYINAKIEFHLNDGIDSSMLKNNITFQDTAKNNIPFAIKFIDDASFIIAVAEELESDYSYFVKINFKNIPDAANNRWDSLYVFEFKTITGNALTGASGSVQGITSKDNVLLVLQSDEVEKLSYTTKMTEMGTFNFERVKPGKYTLWGFIDDDNNGIYSKGSIKPFKYSERFEYYPSQLNLRARWVQSDLIFNFK